MLNALSLGLFAAQHRRGILRLLGIGVAVLVMLPVLMVAALTGSIGAANSKDPSGPASPMASFVVTQPFGCTGLAFEGPYGDCPHFHTGIDLAAPMGAEVHAVLTGVAEVVQAAAGYGLHILLHHNDGSVTLYGHLLGNVIASGDSVEAGQLIGYEGSSGNSTGPHLHFEVRVAGEPVDPAQVFPTLFNPPPTSSASGAAPESNNHLGRTKE